MTKLTEIAELLVRVKAATGPDREIECDLATMFYSRREGEIHRDHYLSMHCYTASIDAALALVERKLPGWRYDIHSPRFGRAFEGVLMDGDSASRKIVVVEATTAPLAILAALLTALQDHPHVQ